jgi:hypothetical protein
MSNRDKYIRVVVYYYTKEVENTTEVIEYEKDGKRYRKVVFDGRGATPEAERGASYDPYDRFRNGTRPVEPRAENRKGYFRETVRAVEDGVIPPESLFANDTYADLLVKVKYGGRE